MMNCPDCGKPMNPFYGPSGKATAFSCRTCGLFMDNGVVIWRQPVKPDPYEVTYG